MIAFLFGLAVGFSAGCIFWEYVTDGIARILPYGQKDEDCSRHG